MLTCYLLAAFLVLHGLVHLLCAGQSSRRFELRRGMTWPDGSWALSPLLDEGFVRLLATICLVTAALGFIASGLSLLIGADWWRLAVGGSAIFASAIFLLLWDGVLRRLDEQGLISIFINVGLLAGSFVWQPC